MGSTSPLAHRTVGACKHRIQVAPNVSRHDGIGSGQERVEIATREQQAGNRAPKFDLRAEHPAMSRDILRGSVRKPDLPVASGMWLELKVA
jgi:hypothetical protein